MLQVQPSVSVIIPVYNAEHFFEKCLRSLFEQTLVDIEYIFVNDCTPDNSVRILEEILEEYPNRKEQVHIVHHKKNMGSGAARNTGMRLASGSYVIHCDSDDWLEKEMYESVYNVAIEKNADIVCCGYYIEYSQKYEIVLPLFEEETKDILKHSYKDGNGINPALWNKLVRRSLYVDNNVYPFEDVVNVAEDLGVSYRLRFFSKKTLVMKEAYYHYNLQNVNSLMYSPKLSAIEDEMKCAKHLESFFVEQGVRDEYFLLIQYLKFNSTLRLLYYKNVRDIKRWKITFSESHKYIFKYKALPFHSRVLYWLGSNGFTKLASIVFDFRCRFLKR